MKYNLEQLYGYAVFTGLALFALFEVWVLSGLKFYFSTFVLLFGVTAAGLIFGTVLGKIIHRTWQFAILGTLAAFDFAAVIIGVGSTWK